MKRKKNREKRRVRAQFKKAALACAWCGKSPECRLHFPDFMERTKKELLESLAVPPEILFKKFNTGYSAARLDYKLRRGIR